MSRATSEALSRAVGLTDVVAHGYQRVDVQMIFEAAKSGLLDLEAFAREVSLWLASPAGAPRSD